jgi:hypothetical protein
MGAKEVQEAMVLILTLISDARPSHESSVHYYISAQGSPFMWGVNPLERSHGIQA